MTVVPDFILGSGDVHARFCAITEVLGKLVSVAPQSLSLAQLAQSTGRTARELGKRCLELARNGLITETTNGLWQLAVDPAEVTLEDVYRCVTFAATPPSRTALKPVVHHANLAVDLLLMQAAIAINQSMHQHLRQFSLDRLKPAAQPPFPAGRQALRGLNYNNPPI
ncbi:Rrf2 family transcriptional regulator [Actimicrobium antarcticum]|uniref:HTH iclR-type domain-containing protein n=1 Tax=Actimicrobium antarcticum TaxID=1051899 RepID=A0ABP7T3D1_9BURK